MNIVLNIGFSTVMKAGKVLGIRWEDIDFKNKIIRVRHTLIDKGNGVFELTTLNINSSVRDIQKRLGHNKISTTMDTYSHVTNKMKTETMNIFEGIIK